jgi:hypothetical protein
MTKPQLTTILIYLKNGLAFIESAKSIAAKAKDDDIGKRLSALARSASIEIAHIEDARDAAAASEIPG